MVHNTAQLDTGEAPSELNSADGNLTRRQLGIAAAWAAPVVAAVATAPLAAASIQDAGTVLSILTTTGLTGNSAEGSEISGTAGGQIEITNVGGGWTALPVTARYSLVGPVPHVAVLLYEGIQIFQGQVITVGSSIWTVAFYGSSGGGTLARLQLNSGLVVPESIPPATSTAYAEAPIFTFATVSNGEAHADDPIKWQLEVGAESADGPAEASISTIEGKSIPAA